MTFTILMLIGTLGFCSAMALFFIAIITLAHRADEESERQFVERKRLP